MSVRLRSAIGAVLLTGGLFLGVAAATFKNASCIWGGAASVVAGMGILGWAIRDVAREIGHARTKYDALLRAEYSEKKEQKPGDPRST